MSECASVRSCVENLDGLAKTLVHAWAARVHAFATEGIAFAPISDTHPSTKQLMLECPMCATPKKSKVAPIESDSYVGREYGAGPAAAQLPAKAISTLAGDASHIHYAKASYRWAGAKVAAAKAFADPYPRHN